jgi:hypothetical protein
MTKQTEDLTPQQRLEQARQVAAEANARAAAAQAAVEKQAHEAQRRRELALAEYDNRVVAEFDFAAETRQVAEARTAYQEAILADPANQAAIAYIGAVRRRAALVSEVHTIKIRQGLVAPDAPTPPAGIEVEPKFLQELVTRAIEDAVQNAWADLMDEREAAREQAGEAAARGETVPPVT